MSDIQPTHSSPEQAPPTLEELLRAEAHAFHLAKINHLDVIDTNEEEIDDLPFNWRLNTLFEDGRYEVSTLSEFLGDEDGNQEPIRAYRTSQQNEEFELLADGDTFYRRTLHGWVPWQLASWVDEVLAEDDMDVEDPDSLPLQRRLSAFYDDYRVERARDLSELIDSDGREGFVSQERLPLCLIHNDETYELIAEDGLIYRRVSGYWSEWAVPQWALEMAASDEDGEEEEEG